MQHCNLCSWSTLVVLAFLLPLQLPAQDCPCDTARLYYRYSVLLVDNPPGFSDINDDLISAGFPPLEDRGLTLYREGEGVSSILSGLEFSIALPSLQWPFSLWLTHGRARGHALSLDTITQGGRWTHAGYTSFGFVAGVPLWSGGPFSVMPVAGFGADFLSLSLQENKGEWGVLGLKSSMETEYGKFVLIGGVQASVLIPTFGRSQLELTVRPAFALSLMDFGWSAGELADPEYTRFLLHIGVGLSRESFTCRMPRQNTDR